MAKLFGFSIEDTDTLPKDAVSPVPPNDADGVEHYMSSGFFGSYVDIEGVYRTEFELIKRYREMALHPECDSAIEDVINEAIVADTHDSPVEIELSNLNASDGIKKKLRAEFKYIKELLDFDAKAFEIIRNWYIDGRLYYHKVIDLKNPQNGIEELRYIDAMKMRYVRKQKKKESDKYKKYVPKSDNPEDFEFADGGRVPMFMGGAARMGFQALRKYGFEGKDISRLFAGLGTDKKLVGKEKTMYFKQLNKVLKNPDDYPDAIKDLQKQLGIEVGIGFRSGGLAKILEV